MPAGRSSEGADLALLRAEWQRVIFSEAPRRTELLKLEASWPLQTLRVFVHRNQPFESLLRPLRTFGSYAGWDLQIELSGYDDSMSARPTAADVELVWLDFGRYQLEAGDVVAWLRDRVAERMGAGAKRIVIAGDESAPLAAGINGMLVNDVAGSGVVILDRHEIAAELGDAYRDPRLLAVSGDTVTDRGSIALARAIAFRALPPLLDPRLKLVAADLDNTLYGGVVAEDGPEALRVEPAHRRIQATLVQLAATGVLVAIVSKNDPADVERLISEGVLNAIPRSSLFGIEVGWGPKHQSLSRLIDRARIGADAVLFVDDNAGELGQAADALPGLVTLHAADPGVTDVALRWHPRLHGYSATREDQLRRIDLLASEARAAAAAGYGGKHYVESLGVVLGLGADQRSDIARAADLSRKTNQFNTALVRFDPAEIERIVADPNSRLVTATLRDRLSDSGTIAAIVSHVEGDVLEIDEIAISCRALGRGAESAIILEAVRAAARDYRCAYVHFRFVPGPRNAPAAEWLRQLAPGDPRPDPMVPIDELPEPDWVGAIQVEWRPS